MFKKKQFAMFVFALPGNGACTVQVSQTCESLSNIDCIGHVYTGSLPSLILDLNLIIEINLESSLGNSLPIPPTTVQNPCNEA